MKTIFYSFLAIMGVSLSIIILMPSFFDINTYKIKLYELVQDQTGYNLNIEGKIGISFLPILKLNAENISLTNKKETLFKAKSLVINPSILSFLKGNIYFENIKLDNAIIIIKKNKDNTYNWTQIKSDNNDEIKNNNETVQVTDSEKNKNYFIIKNLILKNSAVKYQHLNKEELIKDISFNFNKDNNEKYFLKGSFEYKGHKSKINYKASTLNKKINFKGDINSNFYNLVTDGIYDLNNNKAEISLIGNLEKIKNLFNIKFLKDNSFKYRASLLFSNKNISLKNIKISSNDTIFLGNANYNYSKKTKEINIKLNTKSIDIKKFYDGSSELEKKIQKKKNIDENQDKKINQNKKKKNIFEVLDNVNLNLKIEILDLLYKKLKLENIALNIKKKKNLVSILEIENLFKSKTSSKLLLNDKMLFTLDTIVNNLSVTDLNKFYNVKLAEGNINIKSSLKGSLLEKEKILNSIYGKSEINASKVIIKNINLTALKRDISSLNSLNELKKLRRSFLNGETKLNDQKIILIHNKGKIKIPLAKIKMNGDLINSSGIYNVENKHIELKTNFETGENKFLSLFSLYTEGNISKPITKITFDESAVTKVLENMAKQKIKKAVEKKLEKKFDSILENLLD